ncbi:MAG: hypothetical protein AAGC66_04535 [Leifsonia sp.]
MTSEPTLKELAARYPEVDQFRERMLRELWANRGKGDQASWRAMSLRAAWQEISWHAAKLANAIKSEDVALIHELTADVANGAMMLDDIVNSYGLEVTERA